MRWLWIIPGIFRIVKVETHIIMSKNFENVYYAVGRGRETGIFDSWKECKIQVDGVPNAKYRKFYSLDEANDFVNFWKCYTSPVRENTEQNNICGIVVKALTVQVMDVFFNPLPNTVNPSSVKKGIQILTQTQYQDVDRSTGIEVHIFVLMGLKSQAFYHLPTCLQLVMTKKFSSIFRTINHSSHVTQTVKEFARGSATVTNVTFKLQVSLEDAEDKKLEEPKTINGTQSPHLLESSKSVGLMKHDLTDDSIFQYMTSPSKSVGGSSCHSVSVSESVVVKSMDLLALNLRLDSLEKRFDTCLKEIGGILSQVSNIRSEVTSIRELLTVDSGLRSSSSRYSKGGMVQSVLSFGSDSKTNHSQSNKSVAESRQTVISSRLQDSSRDQSNDSEAVSDRKTLKRKLPSTSGDVSSDSDDCEEHPALKSRRIAVSRSSFTVDKDNYVEVYTDGACLFNGSTGKKVKAGIGVWFGDNHPFNVGEPVVGRATNNTAEIQAARVAVDLAISAGISKLKIYTDSEFLINCITKWIYKWQKNGWKLVQGGRVKNKKELEKLYKVASQIDVRWEKVAGHAGVKGNEMADRLANAGAEKYVPKS